MCGIAGAVGTEKCEKLLKSIMQEFEHRGEENYRYETIKVDDKVSFGIHRLGIVDEHNGMQPFTNGKLISIFNGEIYNHSDLKKLLSKDFNFKSNCDSETVLFSYKKWGNDFVKYLDGMFAIAIFDTNEKTLIMARDPMGIKPLYYSSLDDGGFVFASEIKGLATITSVKEIKELSPGTIWNKNIEHKYFVLPPWRDYQGENINLCLDMLELFLRDSVRRHINIGEKKVASLLSGGIDSSLITYFAAQISPEVVAYTLASPNNTSNDLESAKVLCNQHNINHIIVRPNEKDMKNFYLDKGVYMTESFDPVLVRNAVSYHFLCRQVVKDGFKYCLNGEGADELFGGYDFINEVSFDLHDKLIWHSLSIIHNTYLQMADRASMFATLEARVPYMDVGFVKFALSLPANLRLYEGLNKVALRKIARNKLPDLIVDRRKVGMNEGSGYGKNLPTESIYFEAVADFYKTNSFQYNKDLKIFDTYKQDVTLDTANIEEVYNFARYVECGYYKNKNGFKRLQLNTGVRKEVKEMLTVI